MGEITLHVTSFAVLAKSLMPLPDKWHGLQDIEKRYSPALRRPDRQPRRARYEILRSRSSPRRGASSTATASMKSKRRRCSTSRAALRRSVRHPRQRARPGDAAAHRDRAQPQAPDRRGDGARLRDRADLPQRRHRHDPQPRVYDARTSTRPIGTCTTCWRSTRRSSPTWSAS